MSTESNKDKDEESSCLVAFDDIISYIVLHESFHPIETASFIHGIR